MGIGTFPRWPVGDPSLLSFTTLLSPLPRALCSLFCHLEAASPHIRELRHSSRAHLILRHRFSHLITSLPLINPVILLCFLLGVLCCLIMIFEGLFPPSVIFTLAAYWWTPLLENFNATPGSVMPFRVSNESRGWQIREALAFVIHSSPPPSPPCGEQDKLGWLCPLLSWGWERIFAFPLGGVKYSLSLQSTCQYLLKRDCAFHWGTMSVNRDLGIIRWAG